MTNTAGYGQFCPVAMAAEVLCTRWTLLVLRELLAGSTRFNEIRRGVPRMSPALLSKRLRELEALGVVARAADGTGQPSGYALTEAGRDLMPVVSTMGAWGQRWLKSQLSLSNLDPALLMWDMRRSLNTSPLPNARSVVQFIYSDLPASQKYWWLIVEPDGEVDLCAVDPGFEVDLYVTTHLRPMTAIWMGLSTVKAEQKNGWLYLDGDADLAEQMQTWLGLSPFAAEAKRIPN